MSKAKKKKKKGRKEQGCKRLQEPSKTRLGQLLGPLDNPRVPARTQIMLHDRRELGGFLALVTRLTIRLFSLASLLTRELRRTTNRVTAGLGCVDQVADLGLGLGEFVQSALALDLVLLFFHGPI